MSMASIKLATSKDWDLWISVVHVKASCSDVWDLIDPDKDVKPECLSEPVVPT